MKNVDNLKGLQAVRTLQSVKKSSASSNESSAYLALFMLQKEKEILLKDNERLQKKLVQTNRRIEEIDEKINILHEAEITSKVETVKRPKKRSFTKTTKNTQEQDEEKEWKEMSLDY